jgi:hypothetical protein
MPPQSVRRSRRSAVKRRCLFADRDPEAVLQVRLCTTRLDASSQRGSVFTRVASTEHIVMQTVHGYQIPKTHGARPRDSRRHDAVDVCRVVVPDRGGSTSNQALEGVAWAVALDENV